MKRFLSIVICILMLSPAASAHSGRTDENGGHWDNSTGEYHYHHGYPAHQHPGGVCPFDETSASQPSMRYDLGDSGITIDFPTSYYVITQDTSTDHPVFSALGITDPYWVISELNRTNIYVDAVNPEITLEFVAGAYDTGLEREININTLDESSLHEFSQSLVEQCVDNDAKPISRGQEEINGQLYITLDFSESSSGYEMYNRMYVTLSGNTVLYVSMEDLTGLEIGEQGAALMRDVIETITIPSRQSVNTTSFEAEPSEDKELLDPDQPYYHVLGGALSGLVSAVIVVIIARLIHKRRS